MLMNGKINLLLLDEPTNHLDLPSREWIEDAVGEYGETLIFISHDRYFINRFATRIWDIEDGVLTDFKGSYSEYRRFREQGSGGRDQGTGIRGQGVVGKGQGAGDRGHGAAGEPLREAKTKKKPSDIQKELRRLEREIEKREIELDELEQLKRQHSAEYEKLLELGERESEIVDALDELYKQWEMYSEE